MFQGSFVQFTLTPILAIIGAVLGLVGTCLGILNYLLARRTHRMDLSLDVSIVGMAQNEVGEGLPSDTPAWLALRVNVKNHSYFEVTIEEAGVVVSNGSLRTAAIKWDTPGKRIGARDAETLHFSMAVPTKDKDGAYVIAKGWGSGHESDFVRAKCLYVRPIGGKMFRGGRQALRDFKRSFPLISEYPAKGGGKVPPTY